MRNFLHIRLTGGVKEQIYSKNTNFIWRLRKPYAYKFGYGNEKILAMTQMRPVKWYDVR